MNWDNFKRLKTDLLTMVPSEFDYRYDSDVTDAGCVACRVRKLAGVAEKAGYGIEDIRNFLDVSADEALFIYRIEDPRDFFPCKPSRERGITNALHRLDRIADRHRAREQRQPEAETVNVVMYTPQPQDREQQFLMSCRSTACQPVEPEPVAG